MTDPTATLERIAALRDAACEAAYALTGQLRTRDRLRRFMIGLGGAAIVVANARSFAVSLCLTAPMAAASGAIESGLVGAVIAELVAQPEA